MTRVAASPLRPVIYLDGGRDKRDATDEVLLAVADYARRHFGGHLRAAYTARDGGPDLTIEVRVIESGPQSGAETSERPRTPDRPTASESGPLPDAERAHPTERRTDR